MSFMCFKHLTAADFMLHIRSFPLNIYIMILIHSDRIRHYGENAKLFIHWKFNLVCVGEKRERHRQRMRVRERCPPSRFTSAVIHRSA